MTAIIASRNPAAIVFALHPECRNTTPPTKSTPQKEWQRLAGATSWAIKPYFESNDLSEVEQAVYKELRSLSAYYCEKCGGYTGRSVWDFHPSGFIVKRQKKAAALPRPETGTSKVPPHYKFLPESE